MPKAIELLKKPKENRLRKGLPEGVASADKSGELEGVRVDAGIVFAKNRPYVLCVMTTFLKDEAEGERAIEDDLARRLRVFQPPRRRRRARRLRADAGRRESNP